MNTDLTDRTLERNGGLPGFWIHIPCQISIKKNVIVETGIGLMNKNHQVYRIGKYFGAYENTINQFTQIPILLKALLWQNKKFSLFAGPGIYSAFWLTSIRKGQIFNLYNSEANPSNSQSELLLSLSKYEEKRNLNEQGFNRFEFGGSIASSLKYLLSQENYLVVDLNLARSFSAMEKPSLGKKQEYNTTFVFSIGFLKSL